MRISELVAEAGVLAGIKQDYQKGFDAVDKVLNPKRWGEEDRPSDVAASKSINKLDLRDAVNSAATGKSLYEKDQQVLKQAYTQIKAGKFEVNQDSEQLLSALSAAKNLQKLSPQQQQILSAFAQDL
jgi:hypothetical protein